MEKHIKEFEVLNEMFGNIPDRLKVALRVSYGDFDKAHASSVSEIEFEKLLAIYNDGLEYTCNISDESLRKLVQELYFINKTASAIPGFTKGQLINESMETEVGRNYFYLDFFKLSSINMLMRESIRDIAEYSNELLTSKFVLAYFLGTGSFIEKTSVLFSNEVFKQIVISAGNLCKKIELFPEFPDIQYQNYYKDYGELLNYIKINRQYVNSVIISDFLKRRFGVFNECNHYYTKYYELNYAENIFLLFKKKPLKLMIELYETVLKSSFVETNEILAALRVIRALIDKKYSDTIQIPEKLSIKSFYQDTNNPFFRALIYEGKILSILYQLDHPDKGNGGSILFRELVPFYAFFYKKTGKLFSFNYDMPSNLPRLSLVHHVRNASSEKLYNAMSINKLLLWNSEKFCPIVSSTSSSVEIALKERNNCIELGFNLYRIHAGQQSRTGQNGAMFNGLDGVGNEYYFTLNDDCFSFPDFALQAHKQIEKDHLNYLQSVIIYKGMFDNVTFNEKTNAENLHYFDVTYGYMSPNVFIIPRGTGTIFSFTDGQNPVNESEGFLVDSFEDMEQTALGNKKRPKRSGQVATDVHIIGESPNVTGKNKRLEKWSNKHTKLLFHLLVPALFKSFLKGENKLIDNKKFLALFSLTSFTVSFRFTSLIFLCLPFICNSLQQGNDPPFKYMSLFALVILMNLLFLFTVYSHINGKISIAPLKLICRNYTGVIVLLLNIFSLLTLKHYNASSIFWPLFNVMLIGTGLFMSTMHKFKPKESTSVNYQVSINTCFKVFIIFILLNVLFFTLEFDRNMKTLQVTIYFMMLYSFITMLRLMILNFILIYKQSKQIQLN